MLFIWILSRALIQSECETTHIDFVCDVAILYEFLYTPVTVK